MLNESITQLERLLRLHPGAEWLEQAQQRLDAAEDLVSELTLLSAMARRKLGKQRLSNQPCLLQSPAGTLDIAAWSNGDAGRVLLILYAIRLERLATPDLVTRLYRLGDADERAVIVSALALFGSGEALRNLALDCGRSNSLALFAALAVHNPYPSRFYTEHEFNQLVLKALFIGVSIEGVQGLMERVNPELSRMCEDYLEERLAAGREFPADIWLALWPFASPEGERRLLEYASGVDPRQRYNAILALRNSLVAKPESAQLLAGLREREQDPQLRKLIGQSMQY